MPVGLVTLSRLRKVPAEIRDTLTVADVATPLEVVVTARPEEPVVDLLARLSVDTGRRALVIDQGAPTRLVVPVDGSPFAERALPVAAWLAQATDVPIHLLEVVYGPLSVRSGLVRLVDRTAALLVVGSHRRTRPLRALLGSHASRVVHDVEVPALIVPLDAGR